LPITDSHLHFYDHKANTHSFLDERDLNYESFVGNYEALPRTYLPKDYLHDARSVKVEGVIWHEFISSDPIKEVRWANNLAEKVPFPCALVGLVDFLDPHLQETLEIYSHIPRVKGVREHLIWDPKNPRKRFAKRPDVLKDVQWQKKFQILRNYDYKCALEVFAHQLPDLIHIVKKNPSVGFTLSVMGWPLDLSTQGRKEWIQYMEILSQLENTCLSISAIECIFGMDWSVEQIKPWILEAIERFGAERCMFGSHLPIAKLSRSFDELYDAYFQLTASASSSEKELLFSKTASNWFRLHA
jgi:predicted TIM-barrel fold metal-dependent hydrolase